MKNILKICSCPPTPRWRTCRRPSVVCLPVRSLTCYRWLGRRDILRMRRSLYHAGTSRTVQYRDMEGQDETPGRFETPGPAANLCACAVSESSEGEANNGGGARQAGRLDYLRDISISQRRGGVQWPRFDQNGHILRPRTGVARCQLGFMI